MESPSGGTFTTSPMLSSALTGEGSQGVGHHDESSPGWDRHGVRALVRGGASKRVESES